MAATPTAAGSGTQTATVTTEHTLFDSSVAGVYSFHVDTVNMVVGDILELRIYQMVLTSGTRRVAYISAYYGAQPTDDLIKVSVPIGNELTDSGALRFTLKQTFGTSRNFPWKVLAYQMYNTAILTLLIMESSGTVLTGYPAGLFAGTQFAYSSFSNAYGSIGSAAVSNVAELALLGVG